MKALYNHSRALNEIGVELTKARDQLRKVISANKAAGKSTKSAVGVLKKVQNKIAQHKQKRVFWRPAASTCWGQPAGASAPALSAKLRIHLVCAAITGTFPDFLLRLRTAEILSCSAHESETVMGLGTGENTHQS